MVSENDKQLFDKLVEAVSSYASSYTRHVVEKRNDDSYSDERGRALQALGKCVEVQTNFSTETQNALKQVENSIQTIDANSVGTALYSAYLARAQANVHKDEGTTS